MKFCDPCGRATFGICSCLRKNNQNVTNNLAKARLAKNKSSLLKKNLKNGIVENTGESMAEGQSPSITVSVDEDLTNLAGNATNETTKDTNNNANNIEKVVTSKSRKRDKDGSRLCKNCHERHNNAEQFVHLQNRGYTH